MEGWKAVDCNYIDTWKGGRLETGVSDTSDTAACGDRRADGVVKVADTPRLVTREVHSIHFHCAILDNLSYCLRKQVL